MIFAGSVTGWLNQLQGGNPAAMDLLWDRFFHRVEGLARQKLPTSLRRADHEADVALDAFASFWRGVEHGRFPELVGRDNLWRLLAVITVRKVFHLVRSESRRPTENPGEWAIAQALDREPDPQFLVQANDEYRRLLTKLGDARLEAVARLRIEGFTTREIADQLDCSPRTVERKLLLIQSLWAEEVSA
jgi:DNA-directed RNA polymerase specialized sigma24 family protein